MRDDGIGLIKKFGKVKISNFNGFIGIFHRRFKNSGKSFKI